MKKLAKMALSAITAATTVASALCTASVFAITPNPVISRNCPAYSGNGDAKSANDEHYFSFCSIKSPDYLAYDLSAVPDSEKKQVIAVWYTTSSFDNIGMYANSNMIPSDYTIEVNKADGGEYPEDNWEVVETVKDNKLASRQHLVDMEGYNWIRLNLAKADGEAGKSASINLDVHNVSDGISDSWLFLGDSITAGGMNNCYGTGFATHVNQLDDRFFPIQENGGIGGIRSIDGRENIDRWLAVSQAKYVSIAYGTNDCWGNPNATKEYYENTKYMIDAILEAGKIPVLPKIPASTNPDVKDNVPLYNAMVNKLYEEYGSKLVHGVDFEEFFTEHLDYLSGDGVHPSDVGYAEMRKVWAETMYKTVYSVTPEKPEPAQFILGDVNEDGEVNSFDATLILREYAIVSTGGQDILTDEQLQRADVNRDKLINATDASFVNAYYAHRLNGFEDSLDSWANGTEDGIVMKPLKSPVGDFTDEEIESSAFKPEFELETDYDEETNIINVTVSFKDDKNLRWSSLGFVINCDEKLQPAYDELKRPIAEFGKAASDVSVKDFAYGYESDHQLAVALSADNDFGTSGKLFRFSMKDPEGISGKTYNFSIEATDGSIISNGGGDSSKYALIMQSYLFTKGLASTSLTVGGAESELLGDANCDGEVNIADATAIIQAIGNKDRYALSEQGEKNADCYNPGDGVTGMDAMAIQKLEAKQLDKLPEMPNE